MLCARRQRCAWLTCECPLSPRTRSGSASWRACARMDEWDVRLTIRFPRSDINYLNCASPPPGVVSTKQQRDRYRQKLLAAFEPHYHPDHCVPR